MRVSISIGLSLALLPFGLGFVSAPSGVALVAVADAGADAAKAPPIPKCVKVRTEAVISGSGWDHVVSIDNGCDRDADCDVGTDVSEETLHVTVPAGESRDLVTYRGSPASEFKANVTCTLKK